MLADENLRIVYVNPPPPGCSSRLKADFRKELPDFQADKVIGSVHGVFLQDIPCINGRWSSI